VINRKPGFSRKMFLTLEIPFKTGFTVLDYANIRFPLLSALERILKIYPS
jgi:hypothetical protein